MGKIRTKKELVEIVRKFLNNEFSEEEEQEIEEILEQSVPDFKKLMHLMYWDNRNLSPEEIVEEALHHKPIITPPPSTNKD